MITYTQSNVLILGTWRTPKQGLTVGVSVGCLSFSVRGERLLQVLWPERQLGSSRVFHRPASLELEFLLPQPPVFWDFRYAPHLSALSQTRVYRCVSVDFSTVSKSTFPVTLSP